MIGASTSCFYPMETELSAELLGKLGFRRIEIFLNALCECEPEYCRDLRRRLDESGMTCCAVHSPISAYEYLLIFSPYRRRLEDGLDIYRRIFQAADILGARIVNLHGERRENPAACGVDRYCEGLHAVMDAARSSDARLCQENVSWCKSSDPGFLAAVAENMRGSGLGYTLDLKQAVRAHVPVSRYIEIMGRELINVHLSDHNGEKSCLLPGQGVFDYAAFAQELKRLGFSGPLTIEVYRGDFAQDRELSDAKGRIEGYFVGIE